MEEDIGGLPRGDQEGGDCEGLHIDGVSVDYGEGVVGDAEEEVVVECRVDDAE